MKRASRGSSLAELMVVLAISSVLFAGTGICLHGMFRAHDRIQENLQRQDSLERLALRLRADAHAAESARAVASPQDDSSSSAPRQSTAADSASDLLVLRAADGIQTVYAASPAGILRVVQDGETVIHRDLFRLRLSESGQVRCEVRGEPAAMVVMTVFPLPEARRDMAAPYSIQAVVGLHR